MITIKKSYHFHAAHRNETLQGKCRNLHGHTYYVTCFFGFDNPRDSTGVTVDFSGLDFIVQPIIKEYDHALLINITDPIYDALRPLGLKMFLFKQATSAENVAARLFYRIQNTGLPITEIHLQETTSSTVIFKP